MKRKNTQKGFTIVELVIVIAVIAILATVLVPAFGDLVYRAQQAKDIATVKNMNTALQIYRATMSDELPSNSLIRNMDDVLAALAEAGYDTEEELTPICKDHSFYWHKTSGQIAYVDEREDAFELIYPEIKVFPTTKNDASLENLVEELEDQPDIESSVWNADLNHIVFYGQSFSNGSDSPYYADPDVNNVYVFGDITNSQNGTNLTPLSQTTIRNQHPIISTSNVLAQMLANDGYTTKLVLGSYGQGGQSIAQLMSAERQQEIKAEKGYAYDCDTSGQYNVFTGSVNAIANYADATGQSVKCPVIVFLQGERDYYTDAEGNFHAYAAGGDKDTYKLYMTRLKEDMQKEVMEAYGQSEKPLFVIYQVSGSYVRNNSEINMAQIEFAQENADVVLTQTPYFTSQYTTSGHLTQNGYRWMGEYIAKSAYAAMVEGQKTWPMLYSNMECVADNKVSITVSGAVAGLSIDTYTVENATNTKNLYGFNLIVNGNVVKPTAVTVSGNEILITVPDGTKLLSANSITVQYAGSSASGTGNIRDNCTDLGYYKYLDDSADKGTSGDKTISHSSLDASGNSIVGKNYPMYNWLASFSYDLKVSEGSGGEPDNNTPVNTVPVLVETISGKYIQKNSLADVENSAFRIEKYSVTPNYYVNITGFMATDATCAWVKANGERVKVEGLTHGSGSNNDLTVQVPEWAVYIEVSMHKSYTTAITGVTAPVLVETISDTYVQKGTCDWIGASQHRIEKYAVPPGSYVNIKGFLATAATCAWVKADGSRVDVEAPDDITFEHGGSSNNDVTVQVPEWAVYIEVSMHKSYTTTITGVDNNGN